MAGYNGFSMSNNAILAYSDGRMPASAFAAFVRKNKTYKGCTPFAVRCALVPAEWHHTSCKYNQTYFYDLRDLGAPCRRAKLKLIIAAEKEWNRLKKANDVEVYYSTKESFVKSHAKKAFCELGFSGLIF